MLNVLRITKPRAALTLAEKLCRERQKVKRVINLTFVPRDETEEVVAPAALVVLSEVNKTPQPVALGW